ncbi:MAG: hypothetical protein J7518_22655 [Nocardioidaceae bacterium]|nr:hypothetical protein [Nocardioidaceae bacterium]
MAQLVGNQIEAIKAQNNLRRLAAAVFVVTGAVLAIVVSPTVGLVFAFLSVCAVALLPESARRRILGESNFALYDEQGQPRIVMVVTEDGPSISLLDESGTPRVQLGARDGMALMYATSEEGASAGLFSSGRGTGVAVEQAGGRVSAIAGSAEGPGLSVTKSGEAGETHVTLGRVAVRNEDRLAYVKVSSDSAEVGVGDNEAGAHAQLDIDASDASVSLTLGSGPSSIMTQANREQSVIVAHKDGIYRTARLEAVDIDPRGDRRSPTL